MRKVSVTIRQDKKSGEVALFFVNGSERGYWLEGYAHIGQHFEPSREYMRQCVPVHPMHPAYAEGLRLVKEWNGQPPADIVGEVVQRLTYPKGKPYIGK